MPSLKGDRDAWEAAIRAKGHIPQMDGADVDMAAWDDNEWPFHQGAICENCGLLPCWLCDGPEDLEPCQGPEKPLDDSGDTSI